MRSVLAAVTILLFFSCKERDGSDIDSIIAIGQMPTITTDNSGNVQLVYGKNDSLLYTYSTDKGQTFFSPTLIAVVPKLTASHTRGPQIATTSKGLAVVACDQPGNIYSFVKDAEGNWTKTSRLNDRDTIAKENFVAMSTDGDNAFAVWLDLRNGHNEIFGAWSKDAGKTWSNNIKVYVSPDTTVCECCKPSVAVRGNNVYVMFRNWLNGNRDLYLIKSSDGGVTFGEAQKLGKGSWALKGCPMDGGSLTIDKNGNPQTVWNREGLIYSAEPGKEEYEIGKGRNCTMESVNGKSVYAWVEDGNVIVRKPQGMNLNLGKGSLPVIKALNNEHVICIWENDKKIHRRILEL